MLPEEFPEGRRLCPGVPAGIQSDWRWQLEHLIRTPGELWRFLGKSLPGASAAKREDGGFRMGVTPYYAGLIRPGRPDDPILRQVLPLPEEQAASTGTSTDPLAEDAHSPVRGLVHRYPDRALLLLSGFCPAFCRFCMRKRAWSSNILDTDLDLDGVLSYIRAHKEIRDVLLSGGDPLFVPRSRLETLLTGLKAMPHVRILRIGSRAPVTLPMRIDRDLVDLLSRFRPLWLITHFNHPREVTPEAVKALAMLSAAGVVINNQSVLLRGVNDAASILIRLSVDLLARGIRPYYLHQVDAVAGADHFRVPIEEGMEIVGAMFGKVSGLGIPRYVLDLPGGKGKVPLMPDFVIERSKTQWTFRAPLGGTVLFEKEGEPQAGRSNRL